MIGVVPKIRAAIMKSNLPDKVKKFIDHPVGPLTVFFWAPTWKWIITFANIREMRVPVEKISYGMQFAIFITGMIWTRY